MAPSGLMISFFKKFDNCVIPLLASPQGGVAASSRKFRAATEADAAGVVFLLFSSENHPGLAISGGFAIFFLIARPPLLAVMQGGESPYSNFFTAPLRTDPLPEMFYHHSAEHFYNY